jgi:glucose/arabinose dehydrogenase
VGAGKSFVAEKVMDGLSVPAAIQFLPDGRALVAQRNPGVLTLADFVSGSRTDIEGMPEMLTVDDAGLHDVELHPDYPENGWIYIAYSEGPAFHSTLALDRIRLDGARVAERERIFTADAYSEDAYHYGGRIQFLDGFVFLTVGDRHHRDRAQDRSDHAGSIVRLNDDGSVPEGNPFAAGDGDGNGDGDAPPRPEIWSYGHRNPQGFFADAETGILWEHEHGPRGGDELNRIVRGANYGWPVVSFGFEYDGGPIGKGIVYQEGLQQPLWVYVPSIAPSDLVVYRGEAFPDWRGSMLIGSLAGAHLNRLVVRDGAVVLEERLVNGKLGRIRSIAVDQDGLVYLGSDNGEVWRMRPE